MPYILGLKCQLTLLGKVSEKPMSRSQWLPHEYVEHILAGMYTENRLALIVSEQYGCRIGDVLNMKTPDLKKDVWSYKEQKTGKRRRIKLSMKLRKDLMRISGEIFVFEHRLSKFKHRTRQAVFKDLKRVAKVYRVDELLSPHSMRKIYSVKQFQKSGGNMKKVQRLLNHSDEAVTMLYACADLITKKKFEKTLDKLQ